MWGLPVLSTPSAMERSARHRCWARQCRFDLFALCGLVFTNPEPILAFWLGFNALQLVLAAFAFRIDREPLGPLWALPLQQFVYGS